MRILPAVTPTAEQLPILLDSKSGMLVIRGAAGSGKTTTALLRLKQLCATWLKRKERLNLVEPVKVLVLTYNRTLEGYITELAQQQVGRDPNLDLRVRTFGKFAKELLGPGAGPDDEAALVLDRFLSPFGMPVPFLKDEVEYILGRYTPNELEEYIGAQRDGRGASPRMETSTRRRLLDEVIYPYLAEKETRGLRDWNDIALSAGTEPSQLWDVVIVDETQDFSANQVRTILRHVAEDHSVTFVMDSAQRIYPRSFTWKEVGIANPRSKTLDRNFRNTQQIAAFARSLVDGMVVGDDGTLPDFNATSATGPRPRVLVGKFSGQMAWALQNIVAIANLADESVVFLHPLGGGWFNYVRQQLRIAGIDSVQLTRASVWPGGDETVALSTIHSAKGLEFDHVVILGLNQQVTPHGHEAGDAKLESLRRLLAMGIGRARKTVTLGFKDGEASTLISLLDSSTYKLVRV
ncbi:MAG: hypothetical protein JWP19_2210 [Rhodoglobus sp.]|nr:hypothetical protein [Rhodoglobus sp.]